MQLLELFPTIVGVFDCEVFVREAPVWRAEITEAFKKREKEFDCPQHQTDDRLHERPALAGLIDFFHRSSTEYMRALRCQSSLELHLQCCWATEHLRHGRFNMHQHANSFLSGAFYIDVDETSQPILFRDPRPQNRTLDIPVEVELRINRKYYTVAPSIGQLVLFPSWLEHSVAPNLSDVPRVSVSFNMTLHGQIGS